MTIMVIAAHPDDEVLGCGGSISKWTTIGESVHILILAEGATSRNSTNDHGEQDNKLSMLSHAAEKSASILKASSVELLNYPDNRLDSVDLLDLVRVIEDKVSLLKPEIVVTHHSGDLNIDHRIVHQAVLTACRPQPGSTVKRIMVFEILSSTEWQSPESQYAFRPNWFVDVTDTLDIKVQALKAYSMEMRAWPHPRSLDGVKHLARMRGATVGVEAAEAFMLLREIC